MQARVVEDARYAATEGKNPETGKNLSRRPDTLARKNMDTANESVNRQAVAGHVPGIAVGDRSGPCPCNQCHFQQVLMPALCFSTFDRMLLVPRPQLKEQL